MLAKLYTILDSSIDGCVFFMLEETLFWILMFHLIKLLYTTLSFFYTLLFLCKNCVTVHIHNTNDEAIGWLATQYHIVLTL